MFSKFIYLSCAFVCVFAAPSTDVVPLEKNLPTVIPIVSQSEELEANGTFKYSYETGNGIKREEISYDKVVPKVEGRSAASNEGGESNESNEIHVQQGSYSYTAPDGTIISLRYIADENGFQPIGDHLPKAPALLNALQASHDSSERSSRKLADSEGSGSAPVVASRSNAPEKLSQPPNQTTTEAATTTNSAKASEEEKTTNAPEKKNSEDSNVTEAAKSSESVNVTTAAQEEASTKADSAEVSPINPEPSTSSSSEVTTESATTASA